MTIRRCALCSVAILVTFNFALAEEASHQNDHGSGFSDFSHLPSEERRSGFNLGLPGFPGFGSFPGSQSFGSFPGSQGFGSFLGSGAQGGPFNPFSQFFGPRPSSNVNTGANNNNDNSETTTASSSASRRKRSPDDENSSQNGFSFSYSFNIPSGQNRPGMNPFGSFPGFGSLPGFQNPFQMFNPFAQLFGGSNSGANSDQSDNNSNQSDSGSSEDSRASSRRKRSPDDDINSVESDGSGDQPNDAENHQSRLFFSSLFTTRFVTCNYTQQAGSTCSGCRTALTCFPSNVGRQRACIGFFPYCNSGRCSIFPGSACSSSSSTAATTAAPAATTAAAAATTAMG